MNIVANTRPVRGVVIRTKDGDNGSTSIGDRQHEWDEMRFGVVAFGKLTLRVRPRSIEIAQADPAQPIRRGTGLYHALDKQLALAIRIDRTERMFFGQDGVLGDAIDGTRRRKNQVLYSYRTHSLQEGQRTRDVIRVVLQGVLDRFSNVGKSRKVHHIGDLVLPEHLHEPGSIVQISLDKVPPRC